MDTYDDFDLGDVIREQIASVLRPGDNVFIKPNLVDHKHRYDEDVWSVITHPFVVEQVVAVSREIIGESGTITVGDNPHVDCDFREIRRLFTADDLEKRYGMKFLDLRRFENRDLSLYGKVEGLLPLVGDPNGNVSIALGDKSLFRSVNPYLLRGTLDDRRPTVRAHTRDAHRYTFSSSIVNADVFITVPKLKAHAKVGMTCSLKGMVGTIADKNALAHWRIGFPAFGGDEYPAPHSLIDYAKLYLQHAVLDATRGRNRWLSRAIPTAEQRRGTLRGSWEGNDTTWRMTVDIFNAYRQAAPEQRMFSLIDGVIGGETDGPHFPEPVHAGILISSEDLIAADLVAARVMHYDVAVLKYLSYLSEQHQVEPVTDGDDEVLNVPFRPPHNWPHLSTEGLTPGRDFLAERRKGRT